MENARFRSQLADTLAGIDASGCAAGTGAMLKALLRQLPAFAREEDGGPGAQAALRAPLRQGVGTARCIRHRSAVVEAVRSRAFLSDLAEGLAGVDVLASDAAAPEKLATTCSTNSGMSSIRSRSGGKAIGNTFNR